VDVDVGCGAGEGRGGAGGARVLPADVQGHAAGEFPLRRELAADGGWEEAGGGGGEGWEPGVVGAVCGAVGGGGGEGEGGDCFVVAVEVEKPVVPWFVLVRGG
jgi:hypothetical protein